MFDSDEFARRVFACDPNARDVLSEHDATSQLDLGKQQLACQAVGASPLKNMRGESSALPIRSVD
jgi:hypothetical protein